MAIQQKNMQSRQEFLTTKELAARWKVTPWSVLMIAKRHSEVLKPTKPARDILFELVNVKKYEEQRRKYGAK